MADRSSLEDIASHAARSALSDRSFRRARTRLTTDSDGQEALLVTLIVNDLEEAPISGDAAGDAILDIKQQLQAAGEDRSIIVEFATEAELDANGDT